MPRSACSLLRSRTRRCVASLIRRSTPAADRPMARTRPDRARAKTAAPPVTRSMHEVSESFEFSVERTEIEHHARDRERADDQQQDSDNECKRRRKYAFAMDET